MLRRSIFFIALVTLVFPTLSYAQAEIVVDTVTIQKARVLEVTNQRDIILPGTDTPSRVQTIKAEVLEGTTKGAVVVFENDFTQLQTEDLFYLRHLTNELEGRDIYSVSDTYRLNILLWLTAAFLVLLFLFGGIQGIRGLASLCGSFVLIFYLLLPGILSGYSPIVVSIGVSSLIIILGSYITHGFNKTTSAAVLGMIGTVTITGIVAFYVVSAGQLSGYTNEEAVYLSFGTHGGVNLVGLLFGGIMIGLLGVLYDIAIGQAVAVEELFRAGTHLTRVEVYKRGIRIGKEHIGALVNTLAIAYVGMSLPLLLLIQHSSTSSLAVLLNSELFATEIVRILIGSIGLILAVPITTVIASHMLAHTTGPSGHAHTH
jgi:uncharacterized membrane protein